MLRFEFMNGPWENSELPTIVRDNPAGGDPHILAVLKRVHNPVALHELCALANAALERKSEVLTCGCGADCRDLGALGGCRYVAAPEPSCRIDGLCREFDCLNPDDCAAPEQES